MFVCNVLFTDKIVKEAVEYLVTCSICIPLQGCGLRKIVRSPMGPNHEILGYNMYLHLS